MKTQLIPLEAHDDLISVRDRMSWAKTPRILLVWPKSVRIPLRALDLKVLQRHAASLGAQLGLVTRHRDIRREAQALGIPVFNSTGEAQRSPWPERNLQEKHARRGPKPDLRREREQVRAREGAWRSHPLVRILSFAVGVLAVLAIVSLFVPRARIILEPETAMQTVTLPVQADPSANAVFITGSVPARELSVIVSGSRETLATGEVAVPQLKAQGTVTFRNLTESEVSVPFGTVLTSTGLPGVRFITMEQADLPGGLEETVDVPIQAELAGRTGNVEAGTILAIEGDLGLRVAVTNEEPTFGGRDRVDTAPTESDMVRLREELLDELGQEALREMGAMLVGGDRMFETTLTVNAISEEAYSPPLGQPGKKVTLTMQVEFTAQYVTNSDLTELASTVLNSSRSEGYVDAGEPLKFETVDPPQTNSDGITRWVMRVSRKLQKQTDMGQVIPLVQGRNPRAAAASLEDALQLDYTPRITLWPNWWPWLPLIPFNITVESE